ncbi:MAG TPA: YkgJ family cysteine cluster protein [Candidatus Micrarchaeota archaeon]|nr:YkgJ family cysteine cluster protein [Candidatus Micrarchaeota archaeon]
MAKIELYNACKFCDAKCCRGLSVVLTIPEAQRLIASIGGNPSDYIEITSEVNSKETPHYPILVRGMGGVKEYYLILKKAGNSRDCFFLGAGGRCKIYNGRPHICRLYPFKMDGREMKKNALCPSKFEWEAYVGEVAKQLEADLREHGRIARKWMHAYPGKLPGIVTFFDEIARLDA